MKLFVDTWGWITLSSEKEYNYKEVDIFYNEFIEKRGIVFTTDYVMNETITFIFNRLPFNIAEEYINGIFDAIKLGYVKLEFISAERFRKAWELRLKFNDKPKISFTDFTSFVVMDELGIEDVLTGDIHFEAINMGFKKIL